MNINEGEIVIAVIIAHIRDATASERLDLLILIHDAIQKELYTNLLTRIQTISDILAQRIEQEIAQLNSPEALIALLAELPSRLFDDGEQDESVKPLLIKPASYLGVFIRKVSLAARKLSFSQTIKLFDAWQAWIGNTQQERPIYGSSIVSAVQEHSGTSDSYLQFIQAWKRGDYASSLTLLSRHFDYAVSSTGNASYQYALLNLALLQADFGCYKESLWAIYETIDAARDNQDEVCLSFALSWMSELSAHEPGLFEHRDIGEYITDRAQHGSHAIESMAFLARRRTTTGREALYNITKSQHVTLNANESTTISQFLALYKLWNEMDVPELAQIYLSLAQKFCDGTVDTEEAARLKCTLSQRALDSGRIEEARQLLKSDCLSNHAYHRIISTQHAIIRLQGVYSDPFMYKQDEYLEGLRIKEDPAHVEYRVRRYLKEGRPAEAWTALTTHLGNNPRFEALYLRLSAEVLLSSREPARAISHLAKAMTCAATHAMYHELSQCRTLLQTIRSTTS